MHKFTETRQINILSRNYFLATPTDPHMLSLELEPLITYSVATRPNYCWVELLFK